MTEFGLNVIGSILILTVKEDDEPKDISNATVKEYFIKKPDETVFSVTATFNTDGTNGQLKYVFIVDQLDQIGQYEVQVSLESPTWSDKSSSYFFLVRDTLVVTV